jgi:hypothetical protein
MLATRVKMVILQGEQALVNVWCCANKVVNGTNKVVCPTEAMPYGMCTNLEIRFFIFFGKKM